MYGVQKHVEVTTVIEDDDCVASVGVVEVGVVDVGGGTTTSWSSVLVTMRSGHAG